MVKMFSKLSSKENKHLNCFFFIVPALSLNYIDHMMKGKEKINRKIAIKAFLYDDGFVLGVAYLLSLLKQNLHYKTLRWDFSTSLYI
jgi:WASH complex subunit 7